MEAPGQHSKGRLTRDTGSCDTVLEAHDHTRMPHMHVHMHMKTSSTCALKYKLVQGSLRLRWLQLHAILATLLIILAYCNVVPQIPIYKGI